MWLIDGMFGLQGRWRTYAGEFEQELADQGYRSAGDHLYVMAQLSRWLLDSRAGSGGFCRQRRSRSSRAGDVRPATRAPCRRSGRPRLSSTSWRSAP